MGPIIFLLGLLGIGVGISFLVARTTRPENRIREIEQLINRYRKLLELEQGRSPRNIKRIEQIEQTIAGLEIRKALLEEEISARATR